MKHNYIQIFRIHRIRKELKEIYTHELIDRFAKSMIIVFIPIFLLNIGYSLQTTLQAMLITDVLILLLAVPVGFMSSRVGLKHMILYGLPFIIMFVFLLYNLENVPVLIENVFFALTVYGIGQSLYWIPFHAEFYKNSDKVHEGEEVGMLFALPFTVAVLAPIIGGLVLLYFGYNVLFFVFTILMIASVVPLFVTSDYKRVFRMSVSRLRRGVENRFKFRFFMDGIRQNGEYIIWPLYIYVLLGNPLDAGFGLSASALGYVFFTLFIGKMTDRRDSSKILIIGSTGYAAVWILRLLSSGLFELLLLSFVGGLFATMIGVPIFKDFSKRSKITREYLGDSVLRQIWVSLGCIFFIALPAFDIASFESTFFVVAILFLSLAFYAWRTPREKPAKS